MAIVAVERAFSQPVSLDEINCIHGRMQWCFDANSGRALMHGLDSSGLRSLCLYEAPDTEAIRRIAGQMRVTPAPKVWPVSMHGPWQDVAAVPQLAKGENTFALLDRVFAQPVRFEDFAKEEEAHDGCLAIYGVRFLATFFSLDRTRMVCAYAAPDLEAVRSVNRTSGYPFTEILAARPHGGGAPPPAP